MLNFTVGPVMSDDAARFIGDEAMSRFRIDTKINT